MTDTAERLTETAAGRSDVTFRRATPADVAACLDVFYEAGEELHARLAQPILPRNPAPLGRLFEHTMGTDPSASWLAETPSGEVVGFGLAHRREAAWFLGFLFVRPDRQADGIGRRLLRACIGEDAGDTMRATCIEAIQPVSAGLYASFGMLPRVAFYVMTGERARAPLASSHRLEAVPIAAPALAGDEALAEVDGIDRRTLGYAHREDHRMWLSVGRTGYLFRDPASGETVGYGYVSASGRIAPVAVLDERHLPEAIDHLMAAIEPPEKWVLFVPGPSAALVPLLRAGFRFDGPPAIYCSTAGAPAFERYLVGAFALL